MSVILNVYNKIAKKLESKELLEKTDIESGEGCIKYPDGTLIQWGYTLVPANSHYGKVIFKIPYANTPSMTCLAGYLHETNVFIAAGLANTYADVYLTGNTYGTSRDRSFYWHAIGRWK